MSIMQSNYELRNRPSSIFRSNSTRISPIKVDNYSSTESTLSAPIELNFLSQLSSNENNKTSKPPALPDINENKSEPLIKISQYRLANDTSLQPFTNENPKQKSHRYILLTPLTIILLSSLIVLSLIAVSIGFGVAIANKQSKLNRRYSHISYCPRNSSYHILCNMTTEYCQCYNHNDELIGYVQQRRYHDACYRSNECSNYYNLQCNTNTYQCECLDHYYYNGSLCIPMLTYGEDCSILNDTCDSYSNLTCLTGNICACDTSITFWNGQYCETYRLLDSPCDPHKSPSGCLATFTCDNTTTACQCPTQSYFDGEVCLSYRSYLEPCYDTSSCLPNSQLICLWGLCQCDDLNYYWSSSTLMCTYPKKTTYNSTCESHTECESDYGLRCINGQCLCELNSYWTPGNYCDFQSQYNEQCSTAPCLANTGLFCSPNTSLCTCNKYYYWDNFVCQYERGYQSFCLFDYWCRMDLGLRCRNFRCTCSLCSTCFWDGVRCRDCPTSWQIVQSNGTVQPRTYCYIKIDSYVNWNESVIDCAKMQTSYFGGSSHLAYIDDLQELRDISTFATTQYYDIFIGHINQYNFSQWFFANGTLSTPIQWCTGVTTSFSTLTCTRLIISSVCVANIVCSGWTSRYICELD